ncbi:MAG: tyrosine-type recombinase/integrase [Acidobacteriota bacterium]
MNQKVVAIKPMPGGTAGPEPAKTLAANQRAVDALPFGSGTWRIEGVPGLYVRARAQSKSFFVQRRVRGALVMRTLGETTVKAARAEAMTQWARLKPKPAGGRKTFEEAFQEYLAQKELAPKTREGYEYNLAHYLSDWKGRALEDIGNDPAGVRVLFHAVSRDHGKATACQVIRLLSSVYRYQRKVNLTLPECPTAAVDLWTIPPRDWALSADEIKTWWVSTAIDRDGRETMLGVKTLGAVKRMWWLTALLSGARSNSISALGWTDIDFDKRTIRFRVTKGDRPYIVPAADRLIELLAAYRDGGQVPPSNWVFPSPTKPARHLAKVRDDKKGVQSAHHMRHSFRTVLAELGASPDQARLLMGHSMGGDVSRGYITAPLLLESLRPVVNAAAEHYIAILGNMT